MSRSLYITGTDTGIGKTLVSATILAALNATGTRAVGMKPVASGCEATPQGLRNADAEALIANSAGTPDYAAVNPYAFVEPIAPHLAAHGAGIEIRRESIRTAYAALSTMSQCVIVEGVGGWMAPLGPQLMQSDVVHELDLSVILVVGMRLGCLNHALLSARAIEADGCRLGGWVGSCIDPAMLRLGDNLATLRARLSAPCIGVLPHAQDISPRSLGQHLDLAVLAGQAQI
jgi:dethiobiotin synthetase